MASPLDSIFLFVTGETDAERDLPGPRSLCDSGLSQDQNWGSHSPGQDSTHQLWVSLLGPRKGYSCCEHAP